MALRIKSRWHNSERNTTTEKTLSGSAEALAFITWRIALDKAINLHGEDFVYRSDGQRIAVICEYLAYMVQIADRQMAQMGFDEPQRRLFITALAKRTAEHVEDNAIDIFGPGDFQSGFIDTLNERSNQYADYDYTDDGPSYSFMQVLGLKVQDILGLDQTNKWAINQVMEIDAPEVDEKLRQSMLDLLG